MTAPDVGYVYEVQPGYMVCFINGRCLIAYGVDDAVLGSYDMALNAGETMFAVGWDDWGNLLVISRLNRTPVMFALFNDTAFERVLKRWEVGDATPEGTSR